MQSARVSYVTKIIYVKSSDFSIISRNFNGNKRKQKIAESLRIKQLRPTLNIHDKLVPLKLFN